MARPTRALVLRFAVLASLACAGLYAWVRRDSPTQRSPNFGAPDLSSPVRLHGPQTKHGPLGLLQQLGELPNGSTGSDVFFPKPWVQQRLKGKRPQPPSKMCPITWNDKYKIIFIKCTKTAGSTIEAFFSACRTERHLDRCLNYLHVENATQVQHLLDVWEDYHVFTFGRNVLRRAISQYQYLTHFMTGDECPPASWDAFCRDPYILGDICAAKPSCCNQSALHQYLHVIPQANCLLTADQRWAMDWVGRVEHFEEDFSQLLGILNARGGGVPKLPEAEPKSMNYNQSPCQESASRRRLAWDVTNGTFHPCDKMEFFRKEHAHCLPDVMSFFADDIRLLM